MLPILYILFNAFGGGREREKKCLSRGSHMSNSTLFAHLTVAKRASYCYKYKRRRRRRIEDRGEETDDCTSSSCLSRLEAIFGGGGEASTALSQHSLDSIDFFLFASLSHLYLSLYCCCITLLSPKLFWLEQAMIIRREGVERGEQMASQTTNNNNNYISHSDRYLTVSRCLSISLKNCIWCINDGVNNHSNSSRLPCFPSEMHY